VKPGNRRHAAGHFPVSPEQKAQESGLIYLILMKTPVNFGTPVKIRTPAPHPHQQSE
jgi:hypothetical protein